MSRKSCNSKLDSNFTKIQYLLLISRALYSELLLFSTTSICVKYVVLPFNHHLVNLREFSIFLPLADRAIRWKRWHRNKTVEFIASLEFSESGRIIWRRLSSEICKAGRLWWVQPRAADEGWSKSRWIYMFTTSGRMEDLLGKYKSRKMSLVIRIFSPCHRSKDLIPQCVWNWLHSVLYTV